MWDIDYLKGNYNSVLPQAITVADPGRPWAKGGGGGWKEGEGGGGGLDLLALPAIFPSVIYSLFTQNKRGGGGGGGGEPPGPLA